MKTYPMLSFRCDNDFRKAIERKAFERGISISELIKEAITNQLEKEHHAPPSTTTT
jgi:predicted HicB family RNase H-like nuclease